MLERIRFERELSDLNLREYDQNQDLTPTEREVVVGEQIVLNIKSDPRFAGKKIERIEWTVPPRAVKSYVEDANSALATELSRRDLIREKLTFYWVDAGGKEVKARVTVNGKTTEIVFGFDVKAPKVESFKYEVSKPMIVAEKKFSKTNFRISFGDKKKAGVAWDAEVRMPTNFGGTVKALQTVKMGRKKVKLASTGSRKPQTFINMLPGAFQAYQLDLGNRGDGGECDQTKPTAKYQIATKAKPDELIPITPFDTPSGDLNQFDGSFSVDEYFKYFILFKPDKPNSIWVPLVKAEWFWKADAFQKDKKWFLKTKPKPDGGIVGKEEYASKAEFPFYNFNTCDNQWCEIKDGKPPECK